MKVSIQSKLGHRVVELNRRKAIHERCVNCAGWSSVEVGRCTEKECQLYPFRTGEGRQKPSQRAVAIREYCVWCCAGVAYEVRRCVSRDCPLFPYRQSSVDRSVEIK